MVTIFTERVEKLVDDPDKCMIALGKNILLKN